VRFAFRIVLGLLALATPVAAQIHVPEKAKVELDADRTAYEPGSQGRLVALLHIEHGWHVNSHKPTYEYLIPTEVELALPGGWEAATFTYPAGKMARFTFAEEELSVFEGDVPIVASFRVPASQATGEVRVDATVAYQACNDTQCLPPIHRKETVTLRIGKGEAASSGWFAKPNGAPVQPAGGSAGEPAKPSAPAAPLDSRALLPMIALALLGGLILNAMPCVLPVLSIKVFSLVKHASLSRRALATAGLATTAGIVVSFWLLAAGVILARRAGAAVGWGMHFQQPAFVALLAVLVVLFTLNLWGVFEVRLPGRIADAAGGARHEGLAGHFLTGLFATLMATPCSAPFLGTAVGFALGQRGVIVLTIFTVVGLGMAIPYLLLAAWPGAARFLPKPGAWMVRLKEIMGFLLAGAAVWLFYVLAQQVSSTTLAFVQLALLALALAVWLARSARPGWPFATAMTGAAAAAVLAVWIAAAAPAPARGALSTPQQGLIAWTPFERGRAEQLAAAGKLVFVDVTADWCVTCKVNEHLVLDTPEVAGEFSRLGVVAMRADWTSRDPAISALLAEHGRYGVPFYMLYRPGAEPHVFPELITRDLVVGALHDAGTRAASL
jgi:suppressor for copper-sensitivity B